MPWAEFYNKAAFSPSGNEIAIAHDGGAGVSAYAWSAGSGFGAKYSDPAVLPSGGGIDVNFTGTPFDRGCQRILEQMLTVREAENIDVLFMRDRILAGLIEGAWVFESITRTAYGRLCDLRHNAFDLRHKELMP